MIPFEFKAQLWQYSGKSGWHFLNIPTKISLEIRSMFKSEEEGWGRLKTKATINEVSWDTAIWFNSEGNMYLLPVKTEIRKKAQLKAGDNLSIRIEF